MTRLFFILLSISFLSNCSSNLFMRNIDHNKKDILREESYLRYSRRNLNKIAHKNHKAIVFCHLGEIKKGLEILKNEVTLKKDVPEYWNHLSLCYFLDNDIAKAEFYLKIALQKSNNQDPASLNNLGVLRLHQNNPNEAMHLFQQSHQLQKRMISPLFNLSQIYLSYNHHQKALSILKKLFKKSPSDPDLLMGIASAYLMQGKIDKSFSYLSRVPASAQQREDIIFLKILALFQNEKYKKAKDLLKASPKPKYKNIRTSRYLLEKLIDDKIDDLDRKNKLTKDKA